jgi:hypothetical protein
MLIYLEIQLDYVYVKMWENVYLYMKVIWKYLFFPFHNKLLFQCFRFCACQTSTTTELHPSHFSFFALVVVLNLNLVLHTLWGTCSAAWAGPFYSCYFGDNVTVFSHAKVKGMYHHSQYFLDWFQVPQTF